MILTDLAANIVRVNARFRELCGYEEAELIGERPSRLKSGTFPEVEYKRLWETLRRGETWRGRFQNRHKDGSVYLVRATIVPIRTGPKVTHYLGTHEDLRELHELEEALRRSQRLESLGVMAGGIAHEFNNLLTPIFGYTDLVRALEPQFQVQRYLDHIEHAAQRARDLVGQILAFSREVASGEKIVNPNLLVRETLKLARSTLPPAVEMIETRESEAETRVRLDPAHFRQVLMNLLANALWAMRERGGKLEVSCSDARLDAAQAAAVEPSMAPGSYFVLRVRDEGEGISAENLGRVFDPFFSTRPPSESTGLGLSEARGIVLEVQGGIAIESELGVGTSLSVYLPVLDERAQPEAAAPESKDSKEALRGSERVLFVESKLELARLGQEFLSEYGYEVTASESSVEALMKLSEATSSFDILVTAQDMPHLTGLQLAREVRYHQPHLPVLLVTGFSEALDSDELARQGIAGKVLRPFRPRDLAASVRRALDHSSASQVSS